MSPKPDQRVACLDLLRGFAILYTILVHAVHWAGLRYIHSAWFKDSILVIGVPAIIFLSGWSSTYGRTGIASLPRRLYLLYVPYLVMLAFLFTVLGLSGHGGLLREWPYIRQWLLIDPPGPIEVMPVVAGSMWFMRPYLVVIVFTYAFRPLLRRNAFMISTQACLILLLALYSFTPFDRGLLGASQDLTRKVIMFLFFYLLGIQLSERRITLVQMLLLLAGLGALFLVYRGMLEPARRSPQAHKFPPTLYYVLFSLFPVIVVLYVKGFERQITALVQRSAFCRYIAGCGRRTLVIYLYHGFASSWNYALLPCILGLGLPWVGTLAITLAFDYAVTLRLVFIFDNVNKLVLKALGGVFSLPGFARRPQTPRREPAAQGALARAGEPVCIGADQSSKM